MGVVRLWVPTFPPDTFLDLRLPGGGLSLSVRDLLEVLFPPDWLDREVVCGSLDVRANPDVVDCYREVGLVVDQCRAGLCGLAVHSGRGWGRPVVMSDLAGSYRLAASLTGLEGEPLLLLRLWPSYRALDWGERAGILSSRGDLLSWMRVCVLVHLVEVAGVRVPALRDVNRSAETWPVFVDAYRSRFLGVGSSGRSEVTEAGRELLAGLVLEASDLAERFGPYASVCWRGDGPVVFWCEGGDDLRVQAMLEQGVDPYRSVFALRVLDGTLSSLAGEWVRAVSDERVLDWLVEPVVNRVPDLSLPDMGRVMEQCSWLFGAGMSLGGGGWTDGVIVERVRAWMGGSVC